MKILIRKIFTVILVIISLAGHAFADGTFFVVRHAEKQDGDNPVLTQQGVKRATHIMKMLKNEPIKAVFSTETYRTVMTAMPTAADHELPIVLFSTEDLPDFAKKLKAMDGTFLIVAHSSSTPELAALLSKIPLPKLDEMDYEKLFKVVTKNGNSKLIKMITTLE